MANELVIKKCTKCGAIVKIIEDCNCPCGIECCGEKMETLVPNTVDAAVEKHVPAVERVEDEILVRVGEVEHPMEKEHYIMWIAQVKDNRVTMVDLYPEQSTETRFPYIPGATIYAYCNKHGLWKKDVD